MISFCTPCLQWKYILGMKSHAGFSAYLPPYNRKFLNRTGMFKFEFNGVLEGGPYIFNDRIDRATARFIPDPNATLPEFVTVFPYQTDVSGPGWTVGVDFFEHIFMDGDGRKYTVHSQLSNEYTLDQLDADADALIASVNVDQVAWGNMQPVINPDEDFQFMINYYESSVSLLPHSPVEMAHYTSGANDFVPAPQPQMGSAAFYMYMPSGAYPSDQANPLIWPQPAPGWAGWYYKMIGYVKMGGNYCEKTTYVDWYGNQVSTACQSGQGQCGGPFKVVPPPLVVGQTGYKQIVPNCQC